ncbi:MAG: hypothetical protein A3F16_05875 [Deltaproteobacteria bacterium RIFCSPHIGHO2_12_FULL_43_9]|nr:MAG: hypothetical protein A3F16_05875 [Deltaproteobacteria bacterium RIFCSPHIGHO2_12_FULL_43_9]
MNLFKKRSLGIWSIILIYLAIIFINSVQLYELALLYPVLSRKVVFPEMINAGFFIIFPIIIIIGFLFLRAWARRFAILLSSIAIVLNLMGLIKYSDWYLLLSIGLHVLIFYYLILPATKKIFHEAAHHLSPGPPLTPPNL